MSTFIYIVCVVDVMGETTIRLKQATKERLAQHGTTLESFDAVINKVLDELNRKHKVVNKQ